MNWTVLFGIVVLVLLTLVLISVWRLVRSPLPLEMQEALEKKTEAKLGVLKEEWSKRLSEEMERVWKQIQLQVQTTDQSVGQKLEETQRTFADLKEQLGSLKEATEQVEAVGRNVASLQDLLRAPKLRGGFGEFLLADLLSQILPADFYGLQYEFSGGQRVDAIIRLHGKIVSVDAKFPLEEFRRMGEAATDEERAAAQKGLIRDVKIHIDSIAEKYIRPTEGTFDFALMYIPAENVYYETVIKAESAGDAQGIFQHAIERQVIPVSPNSFYAYLRVILLGLRGLTVEQKAKEILANLIRLQQDLSGVRQDFDLAGKQMRHAVTNFEKADRHLGRFEDRLGTIESSKDSPALVEEPEEPIQES